MGLAARWPVLFRACSDRRDYQNSGIYIFPHGVQKFEPFLVDEKLYECLRLGTPADYPEAAQKM
jgi:hypothetical protein